MDIGDMWSLTNREDNNWGIEGYEITKKYNDARKQIWDRKVFDDNMKVWSKKGHYDKKQPKVDKDGNPIVVKRPNYLDEVLSLLYFRLPNGQIHSTILKELKKYYLRNLKNLRRKRNLQKILNYVRCIKRRECFILIGSFYMRKIK